MARRHEEDVQKQARNELVWKQARRDPVCAEYLSQQAHNAFAGGGFAFIETMMDSEEDEDDFRPY